MGGRPVSWQLGDLIRVEGVIRRTSPEHYFIQTRAGSGEFAYEVCLTLPMDDVDFVSRTALKLSFMTERIISVTGRSFESHPIIPRPNGGQHLHLLCRADLKTESVHLFQRGRSDAAPAGAQ